MGLIDERRYLSADEMRGDSGRTVAGLAVKYNALSEDLGDWRERIMPGAFADSLVSGHDVKLLFSHDKGRILGSTQAGTLALTDTPEGLRYRCDLPDTADGNMVLELVRRRDLRELSFCFQCLKEDWKEEDDPDDRADGNRPRRRVPVRRVRQAHLIEISPVGWPAYAHGKTNISLVAAASTNSRRLFPSGEIPVEIRSRVPGVGLAIDPEGEGLLRRAREL